MELLHVSPYIIGYFPRHTDKWQIQKHPPKKRIENKQKYHLEEDKYHLMGFKVYYFHSQISFREFLFIKPLIIFNIKTVIFNIKISNINSDRKPGRFEDPSLYMSHSPTSCQLSINIWTRPLSLCISMAVVCWSLFIQQCPRRQWFGWSTEGARIFCPRWSSSSWAGWACCLVCTGLCLKVSVWILSPCTDDVSSQSSPSWCCPHMPRALGASNGWQG